MEIRSEYLQKYLHDIAIEQLAADYQAKGYQVSRQDTIDKYHPDLVARKGEEVVVFEVKAGKLTPDKRKQVAAIGDYVRNHKNYKFLMVLATPPRPKKIDVPNLDQLLLNYLLDNVPRSLVLLSSGTHITGVSTVTVNELTVAEDGRILAKGNGTVDVKLGDGSSDDEAETEDVFPFNFEIILKQNQNQELVLANAETLEVDVSSFYEQAG